MKYAIRFALQFFIIFALAQAKAAEVTGHLKDIPQLFEEIQNDIKNENYSLAQAKLAVLDTPFIPWGAFLLEKYWYKIAVFSASCDIKNLKKTKESYIKDIAPYFAKLESGTDDPNSDILVQNLVSIKEFKDLLLLYAQEPNKIQRRPPPDVVVSSTKKNIIQGFNKKIYYKSVLSSAFLLNREKLIEYFWNFHQQIMRKMDGIDTFRISAVSSKIDRRKVANYWPQEQELWRSDLQYIKPILTSKCEKSSSRVNTFEAIPLPKTTFELNFPYLTTPLSLESLENEVIDMEKWVLAHKSHFARSLFDQIDKLADFQRLLSATEMSSNEYKERQVALFSNFTKDIALDVTPSEKENLDDFRKSNAAYRTYLAVLAVSEDKVIVTKHLAQVNNVLQNYFQSAVYWDNVYANSKDFSSLHYALQSYLLVLNNSNPENQFNVVRAKKAIQRLYPELVKAEPNNFLVNKIKSRMAF